MKEIGSEFEFINRNTGSNFPYFKNIKDFEFVFSGRTALELVLENERNIKKALLPSYCCDSMIEPFRRANIKVEFYSVNYLKGSLQVDIPTMLDVDCLLWCNYFGFNIPMPDFKEFINNGGILIEDVTHSFLSKNNSNPSSTYLVASLRKWLPTLSGGYVGSRKKVINTKKLELPSPVYLENKLRAMRLKTSYLKDNSSINKKDFLSLFSESNSWIAKNYSKLIVDDYSREYLLNTDYSKVRKKRIDNAKVLYEELKGQKYFNFLFSLSSMDCPLFVPIIVDNNIRDIVIDALIQNGIYCPIHWPKPREKCESNLYDTEISLVCDQRYDETDMLRMTNVLKSSLEGDKI